MAHFLPGQVLCRDFYEEVVAPVVGAPHSAGLLGSGSDVLGYDTGRSTDHDWGLRCTVFVPRAAVNEVRHRVTNAIPDTYRGWPVHIGRSGEAQQPHVGVETLPTWLRAQFGWDASAGELTVTDWLLIPQQRLLGITQGAVFADHNEELARLRERLAWYPDPVWWWMLACQWRRLAQEEPFVQRTSEVGDDLGSQVLAGRLVRDCIRLALLIGRRYAPYSKWLGTAFAALPDPDGLVLRLAEAVQASTLPDREEALGQAYQLLGRRFNTLSPDLAVDTSLRSFFDRPARVIGADRFAEAALAQVRDPALVSLPLIGSVDQMLDCTDIVANPKFSSAVRAYYEAVVVAD